MTTVPICNVETTCMNVHVSIACSTIVWRRPPRITRRKRDRQRRWRNRCKREVGNRIWGAVVRAGLVDEVCDTVRRTPREISLWRAVLGAMYEWDIGA